MSNEKSKIAILMNQEGFIGIIDRGLQQELF